MVCESPLRRHLLRGIALAAGGVALGAPGTAAAWSWPWSRNRDAQPARPGGFDLNDIDPAWLQRQGNGVAVYARFIQSLRLRNIKVEQVIRAHAKRRGNVWNQLPPRQAWRSIGPTLKLLDRVSQDLNTPVVELVSVYRTPAYNARCPGARSGSWHMRNFAVDVKMGARPSQVAAAARSLRARGMFRGGVGRYSQFTHVDTRGTDVDW